MDHSSGLHQDIGSLENMIGGTKASNPQMLDKKPRPQQEQALKCPRCESTNTKFCYYNNYSLSQPRYFCKSCRRYWTKGGTLRNVPVGGGCRKNKRSSSSTNSKRASDVNVNSINPLITTSGANSTGSDLSHLGYESNYLTLAFARLQQQKQNGQFGFDVQSHDLSAMTSNIVDPHSMISSPPDPNSIHTSPAAPAFLDALRSGFLDNPSSNFTSLCYNYANASNTNAELDQNTNPFGDEDHMSITTSCGATTSHGGFPWQNVHVGNGGAEGNSSNNVGVGDVGFDSGREIWSYGLGSSTNNWQYGLLNSAPLM